MIKILKLIKQIIKLISLIVEIKYFKKKEGLEKKLKLHIEKMGPVFIKFAQILSIRSDIFPINIIKELEKLQTHAKNVPFSDIKKNIEEFDKSLYNNIKKINENPIASASIAQIHTAILNNEKKIIIKILKPDVKKIIKRDINILYSISKILTFLFKKIKRLKLIDVIDELKKNLDNETNFKKEISNTIKIKQNTKNINDIYIPNTLESKKEDIFIAEYLDGINITNKEKLIKLKINRSKLIKIILTLFYKQVFEHDIFHADLHPGNILISKTKKNITLILLDFGIIGELKNEEKIYLSENILAFAKQDYKKIIHLHIKANTITLKNNINKMEKEIHDIFKTISNKKLKDIDLKITINSLIKLSKSFDMQIQPNLILFQKTLFTIEGLCRNLNEEINLWYITKNIMEKILINQLIKIKMHNMNINKDAQQTNLTEVYEIKQYKLLSNNYFLFLIISMFSLTILNIIIKYYKVIIFLI